jgi:hypothetical protein
MTKTSYGKVKFLGLNHFEQTRSDADFEFDLKVGGTMVRKIAYWGSTAIVALILLFTLAWLTGADFLYPGLSSREEIVSDFAKTGYPQHVRIVLGIAQPVAAIVLLSPGLALLKEWAYVGVTCACVMAAITLYPAGDGANAVVVLVLWALLIVSYVTRPPSRRLR